MEACLGDRIAIVKEGRIVQVGSGDEIYYLPCNKFVAQLMGEPQINIIAGKMMVNGSQRQFVINVLGQEVALPMPEDAPLFAKLDQLGEVSLEMGLRPQNIAYRFEPAEGYFKAHRLQLREHRQQVGHRGRVRRLSGADDRA